MASFPKRRRARIIEGGREGIRITHKGRKRENEQGTTPETLSGLRAHKHEVTAAVVFVARPAAAGKAGQRVKSSRPPQKRPFTSTVAKRGERARKGDGHGRTPVRRWARIERTRRTDGRTESVGRIYYSFRFQPTPKPKPTPTPKPKPNDVMWVTSQEVFAHPPCPHAAAMRAAEEYGTIRLDLRITYYCAHTFTASFFAVGLGLGSSGQQKNLCVHHIGRGRESRVSASGVI